jgi:TetR/AcrR family transcriptional regulator, tetracycline repressor protein
MPLTKSQRCYDLCGSRAAEAQEGAGMTAAPIAREPQSRRGLRRGSLTPEMIVKESLRLLDEDGVAGFSLPKLGRALGADQTAVYRHFSSKDDLLLAIADQLIEEANAGMEPQPCWVDTVIDGARRLRRTYLAHPAAASLSAYRTTQRPAEMRAVDGLLAAVHEAGFEGAEAALTYRTIADFSLAVAGFEASFLALDERIQAIDRAAWTRAYLAVDRAEFPNIWQVRTELPEVADDDIYETMLGFLVAGLVQRAPRRCDCHQP